jgi:transcription elongation GreA/GreB family factor
VLTNAHNFLVCTAIPAVEIDGNAFVGISEISPVAQALLGKKVGQSAEINGTTLTIEGLA